MSKPIRTIADLINAIRRLEKENGWHPLDLSDCDNEEIKRYYNWLIK
jgi:hypothetical protein